MNVECHPYVNSTKWTVYVWTGHKLLGEVHGSRVDFDRASDAKAYARDLRNRLR